MITRTKRSFDQRNNLSPSNDCQPIIFLEEKSNFKPNLGNASQTHETNLACFQSCSSWNLTLTSIQNKKVLSSSGLLGVLFQPMNAIMGMTQLFSQDIRRYLPIDLRKNQRFVLDTTQQRMNLSMVFDLNGRINHFTLIGSDYSTLLFDIKIKGVLHSMNIFKDLIEFTVKRYDIKKSINEIMNEKKIKLSHIISRDKVNTVFNATVFCNIQCSFAIDFSVSNQDIEKYQSMNKTTSYNKKSSLNMTFLHLGISINKFKIIYYLSLCVFSYLNYKVLNYSQAISSQIISQQQLYMQNQTNTQFIKPNISLNQYILNSHTNSNLNYSKISYQLSSITGQGNYIYTQSNEQESQGWINNSNNYSKSNYNFCNWFSFMTYTTPMIFEVKHLLIKEILDSFILPSLFGVKCVLKIRDYKYTQVTYYPSLSSVFLEYSEEMLVESHRNKTESILNFNNDTDLELNNHPILGKVISFPVAISLARFFIRKKQRIRF